ncbi:MAG: HAMP domain-containing sensor histidine kinase, partial [Prosthecobacter sp.]|nr:HAMP domain-containing sensor histidine kinase [Prosthecobacter sp.]
MSRHRSSLLLFLLAIMPLALLTWLGTYLIRDAARSTDGAMQAVLEERLAVADHQLIHDLREFTDQLDAIAADPGTEPKSIAQALAAHPWVVETWAAAPTGPVELVTNKQTQTPSPDAEAAQRVPSLRAALRYLPENWMMRAIPREQPFAALASDLVAAQDRGRQALWQTSVKIGGYHLQSGTPGTTNLAFPSGWHVTDGDLIYWRRAAGDHLICARLDGGQLLEALFARLPTPTLKVYPGRLTLKTVTGIPLHTWGKGLDGSERPAAAQVICSAPLSQWEFGYTPAFAEFPKPYLFPILLGVGSGSVLVLALAWIFFRENARELRLAQQRVSFVNQISHELKTPLTNIRLYTEMAAHRLEEHGDSAAKRHLGVVEAETARLNRLIQNVLNYARQQRDKLTVQPRQIELDAVIERTVTHWRPLLEGKNFAIEMQLHGPPTMKADADALEQILGNLLSNVDKYAEAGRWVAVRTET